MENRSFKVNVDYGAAEHKLTDGGQNAWADRILHDTVSEFTQRGHRVVEFELVTLEEETEGLDTLALILMLDELRFATAVELHGFAEYYLGVPREEQTIHALGSAFFNNPDEYPEEIGWFALQLKVFANGSHDFWLESVMPRGGRLKWPAGAVILAVKD